MKKILLLCCSLAIIGTMRAQTNLHQNGSPRLSKDIVEKEQARTVAKNFLIERIANKQLSWSVNSLSLDDVTTLKINGFPALYIFSNNGKGFIIISAEFSLTPVIGYSSEGTFPEKGVSLNFDSYLGTYLRQVEWVRKQSFSVAPDIQAIWERYLSGESIFMRMATTGIEPLLNCFWHQIDPYNVYCPANPFGYGGHCVIGCVATAMSMIMYYYRYPLQGIGTHSYNEPSYDTLYVNYGDTYYDWDGMLDQINDSSWQSIPAVALLNYHAGVSVNTIYGPYSSSASGLDVPEALESHFGYGSSTQYLFRFNYTDSEWENMVVEQLDSLKPVYYRGGDPVTSEGHAFVCDGYQVTGSTKMFHFNFGWAGSGNGYYTLANPNGWSTSQGMIRNIVPATGYPYGCYSHVITDGNGSFEDGSSPRSDYNSNLNCTWLIHPADSVTAISLSFIDFNVDVSDSVLVFDGENSTSPILGRYSGSSIPPILTSSGSKLFIEFITDESNESKGWIAEYHSVYPEYCSNLTDLTEPYGSFSDGSGDNNYNNNTSCQWEIQPLYATGLTLSFNSFDLEEKDKLRVYSGEEFPVLLGTFSGNQVPDPIESPTGTFLLKFESNGFNTSSGFDASYTTSNVGTVKDVVISNLSLSPNPAKQYTILRFSNSQPCDILLTICDISGKLLYSEKIGKSKGSLEKTLSLSNFEPGIYLIRLENDNGAIVRKLIIE